MSVTARVLTGVHGPTPYDGRYISGDYRPAPQGFGTLDTTDDPALARRFADLDEATAWWRQEHPNGMGGWHPSGRNRPLTALTMQFNQEEA